MNIRNIIFIITLFVCIAFSAPNVNLVSPYVMRGFSKTYSVSFHPEKFTGYYIIKDVVYQIDGFDTLRTLMIIDTERFNTIGIKDKIEIGFSLFALPFGIDGFIRVRFRSIFNVYNKGSNDFFKNISLTPFIGNSVSNEIYTEILYDIFKTTKKSNNYINGTSFLRFSNYCGMSIGTRRLISEKYSFELFASPSYSITLNKSAIEIYYENIGRVDFLTQTINIPVGFRYVSEKKMVKFSIKSGVELHFIIDEKTIFESNKIESSYYFDSSIFSAFAEFGFHFGARRYNIERRKQLNFKKEVVS